MFPLLAIHRVSFRFCADWMRAYMAVGCWSRMSARLTRVCESAYKLTQLAVCRVQGERGRLESRDGKQDTKISHLPSPLLHEIPDDQCTGRPHGLHTKPPVLPPPAHTHIFGSFCQVCAFDSCFKALLGEEDVSAHILGGSCLSRRLRFLQETHRWQQHNLHAFCVAFGLGLKSDSPEQVTHYSGPTPFIQVLTERQPPMVIHVA